MKILLVLGPVVLLQACATAPTQPSSVPSGAGTSSTQQAPEIDSLVQGDTAVFYDGLLSPLGEVVVGREYFSASGRRCKRIHDASGKQLVAVACKVQENQWYTRKPLNTSRRSTESKTAGIEARSITALVSVPESDEMGFYVMPDETLWSFAKRTTGNALNWERIAQVNNIDNESALETGAYLIIPAELSGNKP